MTADVETLPVLTGHGPGAPPSLLDVRDLKVEVRTSGNPLRVVDGAYLRVPPLGRAGLVGESGSGKTMTALSILGLLGRSGGRASGQVIFEGRDLLALSPSALREVRGKEIGMIFQEPMTSLNPAYTVGAQVSEGIRRHLKCSRRVAWARAVELLDAVRIPNAARRATDYPHMFSGGMRQRVMIAGALACRPRLLIADEPTTALDVTVQAEILQLLRDLQDEFSMAVVLVTHDLAVVAEFCDTVTVMYAGQTVHAGPVMTIFQQPRHPYVEALFDSLPSSDGSGALRPIEGEIPLPGNWPPGCRFAERCRHVRDACLSPAANALDVVNGTVTRCARAGEVVLRGVVGR